MTTRPGRAATVLASVALAASLPAARADDTSAPAATASSPAIAAVTQQPRPFGYVVGDLLTQRVLLDVDGRAFEPSSLPPPARLGAWFERRASHVETASDGRRWLVVDYQVVNAPAAVSAVRLASWELPGRGSVLRVPAWEITVAPLTAAASAPADALRPDRPAPLRDIAGERHRLAGLVAGLAACIAGWLAWIAWREWRARRSLPFAHAMQALQAQPGADGAQASRILHAAFDRTAAEVVRTANLPRLFERAPHLAPLRARIERFFAQSEAFFFGSSGEAGAEPALALCRDLRRLERAAER